MSLNRSLNLVVSLGTTIFSSLNPFNGDVPFTPGAIEGLNLWLDGADASTYVHTSNRMTQWIDKSPEGNNVNAGGQGPLVNVRTTNGVPTVHFDGTDSMNTGSTLVDLSTSDFTLFSIIQSDIHAADVPWSFGNQFKIFDHSTAQWRVNDGIGVIPDTLLGPAGTTGQPRMISMAGGSLSADIQTYFDGVQDSSGAATFPTGGADFTIGAQFQGHTGTLLTGNISEVIVYNRKLDLEEIAEVHAYLENKWKVGAGAFVDAAIGAAGQSNMERWDDGAGLGKANFETQMNLNFTSSNWINGATSGAALLEEFGAGGNQYLNTDGTDGAALTAWKTAIGSTQLVAGLWSQGERDGTDISDAAERGRYKDGLLEVFSRMHTHVGYEFPIIIQPIGRRALTGDPAGWQDIREIQKELANEYDWVHVGPEVMDLDMADNLHFTEASYGTVGTRYGRFVSWILGRSVTGSIFGPYITGTVLSANTVTVNLAHDGGTDFTPVVDINGFRFFDDGAEIAVTAAVRTDAVTITLTLASTPTGTDEVYYMYRALDPTTEDYTLLVNDNSASALPLRSGKTVSGVVIPSIGGGFGPGFGGGFG